MLECPWEKHLSLLMIKIWSLFKECGGQTYPNKLQFFFMDDLESVKKARKNRYETAQRRQNESAKKTKSRTAKKTKSDKQNTQTTT